MRCDLRIKPHDTGDRFGDYVNKRIEWHGLEKDMHEYFESIGGVNLQTVSIKDYRELQERVDWLENEVKALIVQHAIESGSMRWEG